MIKIVFTFVFSFISLCLNAGVVVKVQSQADFDKLQNSIVSALAVSNDVTVELQKGTYTYSEKHIDLSKKNYQGKNLTINGNGSSLFAAGTDLKSGDKFSGEFTPKMGVVTSDGKELNIWDDLKYSDGKIEVVNETQKLCRLKNNDYKPMKSKDCKYTYIWIPQWYTARTYKVEKIEKGYIYFIADNLGKSSYADYNVNTDIGYGKLSNIRFHMCNVQGSAADFNIFDGRVQANTPQKIRIGSAGRFFRISGTQFSKLILSGINFYGGAETERYLLDFVSSKCGSVVVKDCSFEGMKIGAVNFDYTANCSLLNSIFNNCHNTCARITQTSDNSIVSGNKMSNIGLYGGQSFAITTAGKNFTISDNTISDFAYSAIGVGLHYTGTIKSQITGIIENNNIFYTSNFYKGYEAYTLMDSGAIYAWSQNDNVIIRNNNIHDYIGMRDNRGIFCDDGAKGLNITNNVITGIANSWAIDSRRVKGVESKMGEANINVEITNNITDGSIRFQGRESKNNGCKVSGNILLNQSKLKRKNDISNVSLNKENERVEDATIENGVVTLPSSSYKKLKKSNKSITTLKEYVKSK